MNWEQITGFVIAWVLMLIGLVGSILPVLPSTPIVFIAAVLHRLYFGENSVDNWVLVVMGLITAFSLLVDHLASMYGAKRLGASRHGIIGAVVGGVIGLFFNIPGILLGPFIGAFAFEILAGRDWKDSGRAGAGATLGLLGGVVGKIACCIAMMGMFTINVIYRSWN